MFGYIVVHRPELKFKEFDRYHAYYCGVCRDLKKTHGIRGQMTLSYDLTFLAILLTGLYEPAEQTGVTRCAPHPFAKHEMLQNPYTAYAADMNVLLAYYKALDDRQDEKKLRGTVASGILLKSYRNIEQRYPEICEKTAKELNALRQLENASSGDIDAVSGCFGDLFGRIFRYREDEWADTLARLGFYLGKYIYLLDAYDDIEDDIKKGNYNPLISIWYSDNESFDTVCGQMLKLMISECTRSFETLPVLLDAALLRNILYAGVWARFEEVRQKRAEKNKKKETT